MKKASLVVHSGSHRMISAVVASLVELMGRHADVELIVSPEIGAVRHVSSPLVFVIGERFGRFERLPGRRYVYLNFSMLYPQPADSVAARSWIARKHRLFADVAGCYDLILDFDPRQSERLRAEFGVHVQELAFGIRSDAYAQDAGGEFDICFVGSPTPRRRVLAQHLVRSGLRLSPQTGVVLENIAARSKVVLNVHAFRSANIEVPRILSAFLSGAALVTEDSAALTSRFPAEACLISPYAAMGPALHELLADAARRKAMADIAKVWVLDVHMPRCEVLWRSVFDTL